jgi:hypothetical protein
MAGKPSEFWRTNNARLIDEAEKRMQGGRMPIGGWSEIARIFGKPADQCNNQYRRAKESLLSPDSSVQVEPKDPVMAEQERIDRVRKLRAEQDLIKGIAGEQSLRSLLEKLARETASRFTPPPAYTPKKTPKDAVDESMLMQFSDWHGYEKITLEGTRGLNEYNADIMAQRVRRVVESHLEIKERMERGGYRFRRLVIGSNGDYVPGTIHELERHTDAPNVIMGVYGTAMIFAQAIRDLSAAYPSVEIFCTSGNHGRLPDARKVQRKEPTRNWDTLVALLAHEHLRDLDNVKWFIPNSYSVAWELEGHVFLQTHGHEIKSAFSIPYYGVNRYGSNINALEAQRHNFVNYLLLGHFHTLSSLSLPATEVFMNGSLCGGTEGSVDAMGKSDKPVQWCMGVHKRHGVTHRWPIWATTEPDAPAYEARPWAGVVGDVSQVVLG